jgi:hypothetical protein
MGSMLWLHGSVDTAEAEEPVGLTLQISITEDDAGTAAVGSAPVFEVGDVFKISVVAQGVTDPGLFGSQFEVTFNTDYLQAVDGSLVSGGDMEPVVVAVSNIDAENGVVSWAASRQGDLDNLTGDVVLATLSMEAVGATEPPEGQTTRIDLQNVKLGTKGGVEVPFNALIPLDVIIKEDSGGGGGEPGDGDIVGNVKVEGRAADNQAGHTVNAVGSGDPLSDDTDADGTFFIDEAPADTYTVTADSAGFLAATCSDVVHAEDALTTLADVTLLAGDVNKEGDSKDVIDITDAVAIGAVFGSTAGDVADLNVDGVVDILDLILMSVNFGQTSDANPWACQLDTEL